MRTRTIYYGMRRRRRARPYVYAPYMMKLSAPAKACSKLSSCRNTAVR